MHDLLDLLTSTIELLVFPLIEWDRVFTPNQISGLYITATLGVWIIVGGAIWKLWSREVKALGAKLIVDSTDEAILGLGLFAFGMLVLGTIGGPSGRASALLYMALWSVWSHALLGACFGNWACLCWLKPMKGIPFVLAGIVVVALVIGSGQHLNCTIVVLMINTLLGLRTLHRHYPLNLAMAVGLYIVGICGGMAPEVEGMPHLRWTLLISASTGIWLGWTDQKSRHELAQRT